MSLQKWTNNKTNKSYKQLIYIHISCKCDTNRAGHFTLDAHASRPVACMNWSDVSFVRVTYVSQPVSQSVSQKDSHKESRWMAANGCMMASSNGNISALLALCEGYPPGEFPSQRPVTQSSWCFLWSVPEQTVEQTIETPVIWDAMVLIMTSLQWWAWVDNTFHQSASFKRNIETCTDPGHKNRLRYIYTYMVHHGKTNWPLSIHCNSFHKKITNEG